MAPMTRRSQANTGVTKKVHRKRGTQAPAAAKRQPSDSWELLDRQGLNGNQRQEASDEEDQDDQLALEGPVDVQGAIDPLREMADRIGSEVETFAQTLDQMLSRLPSRASEATRFEWANEIVQEFQTLVEGTVIEMGKSHERERLQQARKQWGDQTNLSTTSNALEPTSSSRSSVLGEKKAAAVKEMQDLQQEADLWDLFHIMLELHPFSGEAEQEHQEKMLKLKNLGPAHRYTSEDEMWERFELSNEAAVGRKKVKQWLESTADHQSSGMYDVVAELETRAGRGKGLWKSGWMHTREKIKGEKRLQSWADDVDADPPHIRRTGDNDLLTIRLDPDAQLRQQRTLEKPDDYFERAVWIACWEMLRRGKSVQEIDQWCEERDENWRAMSVGLAVEPTEPGSSKAAWRHLCRLAAQSGTSSDHERAVFGLLGGSEEAVAKVCRTFDDRLYAFYSAKLLRAFDSFVLERCPEKAAPSLRRQQSGAGFLETQEQATKANKDFLARLRKEASMGDEMLQPMKVIQTRLLMNEVGSFINTLGIMIEETARAQDAGGVIYFRSRKSINTDKHTGEREVALDPQTLRMAAHMSIVYRVLEPVEGDERLEDDNVLVAYIQALRMAGKRDLIPMYAANLHRERYVAVLGRVLRDISEGEEQNRMLKLLQDYKLDIVGILSEHLDTTLEASFAAEHSKTPLRILERTPETKLHPGQRIIVGFLKDDITETDQALVTALHWYQLYRGHWAVTFQTLTNALLRCLILGNLACARLIVQTFPYETICLRKTYETIGRSIHLMDEHTSLPDDKHDKLTWDLMKRQSRTYYELEFLVRAIEALAHWREEENKYISKATKPSTIPSSLKDAKTAVTEAMGPILRRVLLHPRDQQEADDLEYIRQTFIPEIVIAYNTVLHAAGNLITRDYLLESMDLSVAIAQDGNAGPAPNKEKEDVGNGLVECFTSAGRMRELVSSFALTSKVMLLLKAEGKPWKARKDREGKELGIWEIGSQESPSA